MKTLHSQILNKRGKWYPRTGKFAVIKSLNMSTTWAPGDLHLFFITADVSESTDLIGKCDPYIVFGWTDEPDTKLTKKNSTKTKVSSNLSLVLIYSANERE